MKLGRGGGIEVSAHVFYTDKLSSNPGGNYFCLLSSKKMKINEKEAGIGPFLKPDQAFAI